MGLSKKSNLRSQKLKTKLKRAKSQNSKLKRAKSQNSKLKRAKSQNSKLKRAKTQNKKPNPKLLLSRYNNKQVGLTTFKTQRKVFKGILA